jgi:hypothetical protein
VKIPRVRFTIGRLMIVVAIAGALSAWLRVPGAGAISTAAVLDIAPMMIGFMAPSLLAAPGRRLLVATWVASLGPLSIPWSLHMAWVAAYGFLGHAPGPADNGLVIDVLSGSVALFMLLSLFSTIVCLGLPLGATYEQIVEERAFWAAPTLLVATAWVSVRMIWLWDPVNAAWWIMD